MPGVVQVRRGLAFHFGRLEKPHHRREALESGYEPRITSIFVALGWPLRSKTRALATHHV
jgi:hypothetical protein